MRLLLWGFSFSGLLSDLLVGVLLCLLLYRCRMQWVALVLLVWAVGLSASMELVEAVGRMPELADLAYLSSPDFITQSTEGGGLSHPSYLYALLLMAAVAAWLAFLHKLPETITPPKLVWLLPLGLLALHTAAMRFEYGEEPWKQYNILHKLVAEKIWRSINNTKKTPVT